MSNELFSMGGGLVDEVEPCTVDLVSGTARVMIGVGETKACAPHVSSLDSGVRVFFLRDVPKGQAITCAYPLMLKIVTKDYVATVTFDSDQEDAIRKIRRNFPLVVSFVGIDKGTIASGDNHGKEFVSIIDLKIGMCTIGSTFPIKKSENAKPNEMQSNFQNLVNSIGIGGK